MLRSYVIFLSVSLSLIFSSALSARRSLSAASHCIRHYTVNDGLASNAVYSFCQDSKGRMWVGTIDGLHSFDGYHIREWRDDSLPSLGSIITVIREDSQDRLWVGTRSGVALFDLRKEMFLEVPVDPASGVRIKSGVNSILLSRSGAVWISTSGEGIFRYDTVSRMLSQYTGMAKLPNDVVRPLMEDSEGRIWAGTHRGLVLYNPAQDRFVAVGRDERDARELSVTSLFEDSRHNIWVGSRNKGLFLYDKNEGCLEPKLTPTDSNSLLQVRDIKEWREGELLLASDQGLTSYDITTGEITLLRADRKNPDALNDNYLQTLYIDREEGLWIGSYFGGINYMVPTERRIRHFYGENSTLTAQMVSVFASDGKGGMWIGSDDAGVFHWNRDTGVFTPMQFHPLGSASPYKNIHALLQDEGRLFIGMYLGGLDIVDLNTGTLRNYKEDSSTRSLYSSSIYAIYRDSRGNIWVGTTGGLNRYCPETDDFERIFEVHPADVECITEDRRGDLWVCTTDNGVYRLDRRTDKWSRYHSSIHTGKGNGVTLPAHSVVTAECDDSGNLWLGTDGGGLLRFDYGKDEFVKEPLPASMRVINKIISDDGKLWLGTSKGLYCYNPQTATLYSYDKNHGLQSSVFLPDAGLKTEWGEILMGGINGFNAFDPSRLAPRPSDPEVILVDFEISNHPVELGAEDSPLDRSITYSDRLDLSHTQRMISLRVVPVSYLNPSRNSYRYKLEGFDKDWNEGNPEQRLTYTNLPPGHYTFRVKTSDGLGGWNEDAFSLPVTVSPPWWFSPVMIGMYLALAIGVLIIFYRRLQRKHREKLEKIAIQKDHELYQSKIDFFTSIVHEIRTPLTLILSPLENLLTRVGPVTDCRPQLAVMQRNGQRLLTLVNHLLDFRKMESGTMKLDIRDVDIREELDGICRNYILTASLRNLDVHVSLPSRPCMARVDKEAFTQIVNNLLSNALKFSKSEIDISLCVTENGMFRLIVGNNGDAIPEKEREKIFTPFYQIAENRPADNIGTGLGLLLVRRYARLMDTDVAVRCEGNEGAEFIIDFPPSAVSAGAAGDGHAEAKTPTSPENVSADLAGACASSRERILVVDDNRDMLEFLRDILSERYEVECVESGEDALESVRSVSPDLIVSDVMMPGMSGTELCRAIRGDINTSHIPVMLLTAKVENSDYVSGFDSGADLYVAKPFSTEVIQAQIRSLLVNRARLRRRFASEPEIIDEIVPESGLDKEFFTKMRNIIEERMTDSTFTVDVMAKELAISRTGLFTKLKALAGMTPNDYIRLVRLQKAAALLKSTDMRISEVCWQVGFSSRSHFTKCFQEKYGMSPKEYKAS